MKPNTFGIAPHAIPTLYHGVNYRSRFEADCALLLDRIGRAFEYEPQSFLLDDGTHYLPDFYVPSLRLWIECRGYESKKGGRQVDGFAKMVAKSHPRAEDYLVLGGSRMGFYHLAQPATSAMLGRCRDCGTWTLVGAPNQYACASCGAWGLNDAEFLHVLDGKILIGPVPIETWARPAEAPTKRPETDLVRAIRAATSAEEENELLRVVRHNSRERAAELAARRLGR